MKKKDDKKVKIDEVSAFCASLNKSRTIKKVLIGFGYRKGSGKSTAADYIIEEYLKDKEPWFSGKTSFAESLKMIATESFGWDGLKDGKGRKLLQEIGSTARHYNPNFWVDILTTSIRNTLKTLFSEVDEASDIIPNILVIVDDARYEDEVEGLRLLAKDGTVDKTIIIRIDRNSEEKDDHASEHGLDDYKGWDYIVDNNATIEELKTKIDEILIKEGIVDEGMGDKINDFIFEQILKEDVKNGTRAA